MGAHHYTTATCCGQPPSLPCKHRTPRTRRGSGPCARFLHFFDRDDEPGRTLRCGWRRRPGSIDVEMPPRRAVDKRPFDIDEVMRRVRRAVDLLPDAALFELADEGFDSPFEQLVACMISIRTRDEVTLTAARRLFARARTPRAVSRLSAAAIDKMIHPATFHERKAGQIREIARTVVSDHGGELPCDRGLLLSFHGIGPKCANLVMGIACGEPRVSVDTHVHRVTNRWGYVSSRAPEQTMRALEERLPKRYWVEINRVLVPFGKHICTPRRPGCSTCPVLEYCRQVGVGEHR